MKLLKIEFNDGEEMYVNTWHIKTMRTYTTVNKKVLFELDIGERNGYMKRYFTDCIKSVTIVHVSPGEDITINFTDWEEK